MIKPRIRSLPSHERKRFENNLWLNIIYLCFIGLINNPVAKKSSFIWHFFVIFFFFKVFWTKNILLISVNYLFLSFQSVSCRNLARLQCWYMRHCIIDFLQKPTIVWLDTSVQFDVVSHFWFQCVDISNGWTHHDNQSWSFLCSCMWLRQSEFMTSPIWFQEIWWHYNDCSLGIIYWVRNLCCSKDDFD